MQLEAADYQLQLGDAPGSTTSPHQRSLALEDHAWGVVSLPILLPGRRLRL
jgi:hypothetical protein